VKVGIPSSAFAGQAVAGTYTTDDPLLC